MINVSSMASVLPIPDFAIYAASKAYVTSFSEALRHELRADGVHVVALCPGPVRTEFGEVARREGSKKLDPPGKMLVYEEAEKVVRMALEGAEMNRARVFPGWPVRMIVTFIELLPAPLLRFILGCRKRHDVRV